MPLGVGGVRADCKCHGALSVCKGLCAVLFMVLFVSPLGMRLCAQTLRVRLVNGKNGHPMAGRCVNVWVGTERKDAMAIPTDKDGVASFHLAEGGEEINTQNRSNACGYFGVIDPVVKYADSIRVNAGYVSCQPHTPNYSWLGMTTFPTQKVIQSGVVTGNTCGRAKASPEPGEIVLFVRPLTWWEKLKQ